MSTKTTAGRLVFRTLPSAGSWTSSDGETYTDETTVEDASPELVRDASHAHAAGILEVTEGLDLEGVQSQEDGEAEYAKAQEDGRWMEGQELYVSSQAGHAEATIGIDTEPVTTEDQAEPTETAGEDES